MESVEKCNSYRDRERCRPRYTALFVCTAELFGLRDSGTVEVLQDQAQVLLGEYVRHQYPRHAARFGRLLLILPAMRAISGHCLARLFFKQTIGNIPVERLVCDIYQTEKAQ